MARAIRRVPACKANPWSFPFVTVALIGTLGVKFGRAPRATGGSGGAGGSDEAGRTRERELGRYPPRIGSPLAQRGDGCPPRSG